MTVHRKRVRPIGHVFKTLSVTSFFKKLKEAPISACIHRVGKHSSWKIYESFILHPIWIKTKHNKKKYFKNCKYDLLASLSQVYKA